MHTSPLHLCNHKFALEPCDWKYFTFVMMWISCFFPFAKSVWHGRKVLVLMTQVSMSNPNELHKLIAPCVQSYRRRNWRLCGGRSSMARGGFAGSTIARRHGQHGSYNPPSLVPLSLKSWGLWEVL